MPKHKRHKKKHEPEAESNGTTAETHGDRRTDSAGTDVAEPPETSADAVVETVETVEAAESKSPEDRERDALAAEVLEMRSLAQRTRAEFENYRKRVERERMENVKYAAASVIKEILPVLDNLERAVEAASKTGDREPSEADQLREGVAIVTKQFRDTLEKEGLREVEAEGALFDPHVHEAVHKVETDEHPEGTVVAVLQKGYKFKDRLLRPSMVSVAQSPEGSDVSAEKNRENEDEPVPQGE